MNTPVLRRPARPGLTMLMMGAAVLPALFTLTAPAGERVAAAPAHPQTAAMGTLSIGQSQLYPQGCMHNGNRAICNFVLVFTGQQLATPAWNGATAQILFVDNAHVPHKADTGYFIDNFGAHQPQLILQRGDQAWIAFEFPDVDPAVSYGEFHWGNQIIGQIGVVQPNYALPPAGQNVQGASPPGVAAPNVVPAGAPPGAGPQLATYAPPAVPVATGAAPQSAIQQPACTAQNATSTLCKANAQVLGAQNQVGAVSGTANQLGQSVQSLKTTFGSLFGAPAQQPKVQQPPQSQYAQPPQPQYAQPPQPQYPQPPAPQSQPPAAATPPQQN